MSSSATYVGWPARADSGKLLDPEKNELIALLANGELHAVSRLRGDRIRESPRGGDRHQFHRAHAERRDGLVAQEDQVGRRAGHDRPSNLVGRRTEDRAPDPRGEGREERHEEEDGDGARNEGSST